jgi:hypothetical protein
LPQAPEEQAGGTIRIESGRSSVRVGTYYVDRCRIQDVMANHNAYKRVRFRCSGGIYIETADALSATICVFATNLIPWWDANVSRILNGLWWISYY